MRPGPDRDGGGAGAGRGFDQVVYFSAGAARRGAPRQQSTSAKELHVPLNQYEIDHLATVRENAPESMVLLASGGSFPLAGPGELALR